MTGKNLQVHVSRLVFSIQKKSREHSKDCWSGVQDRSRTAHPGNRPAPRSNALRGNTDDCAALRTRAYPLRKKIEKKIEQEETEATESAGRVSVRRVERPCCDAFSVSLCLCEIKSATFGSRKDFSRRHGDTEVTGDGAGEKIVDRAVQCRGSNADASMLSLCLCVSVR